MSHEDPSSGVFNVRHSSRSVEHYTPASIVEAARRTLGRIDLDPASCRRANERIAAECYFDQLDDGLTKEWWGRVFLNPPGGKVGNASSQRLWWDKLAAEYAMGHVVAAIFVSFSIELLQTAQVGARFSHPLAFPICFPKRRIAYLREDGEVGSSPPHSSMIVYLPPKGGMRELSIASFASAFDSIGMCVKAALL